ncbi:type I-C CRISPR-associated protein Cas8c/Csd1 [Christensenellaceae bacterium]|nr:type I-C CRISPR-associated protein Cas8c/Csd1 [Christensenellaceae bacterium]BDF62110.1 type I-C CRISPR-associated protein Cas8c/Csd1 [Christensenellaceae bacterium]
MGLFQNLLETYDKCKDAIGIPVTDADGSVNEKKTLLPIFHTTFKSEICVYLDCDGGFVRASRDRKEITIIIPCTEESSGRSNDKANPQPHPLCDQLDYVGGIKDKGCKNYLTQLAQWKGGHAVLNAIYAYVAGGTIISDLMKNDIFKDSEYRSAAENPDASSVDYDKIRKIGIRFAVQTGERVSNVWEDKEIRDAWIDYVRSKTAANGSLFDYLSGCPVDAVATQHPKNINSMTGNAKLLSCNDTSGFTFRGRFAAQDDAVIVDYVQSQKMHQMLRWLIANYGYMADSQVIVTWAVDSDTEVKEKAQDNTFSLFRNMKTIETDADALLDVNTTVVYAEYAQKLKKALQGYGKASELKKHARRICIAVFDAATTGRMGLLFYQEMPEHTYLENIVNWHTDTSYFLTAWKKEKGENGKDKSTIIRYIGAPSYDDILFAVYGKPRGGNDAGYNNLKKKVRKQLLECMFGNFALPESMVKMAANRTSHPMSFTDAKWENSDNEWTRALNITCALIRKYYKQHYKEGLPLELDELQKDRSYLYGRWLAVADKIEEDALRSKGKQGERATNAIRLMSSYAVKPLTTKLTLSQQLQPYINQRYSLYKNFFLPLITEIDEKLEEFTDNNEALSPLYLLGYSAQYRALSKNNKLKNSEENDDGSITE